MSALVFLAACFKDETLSGYADQNVLWQLAEVDDKKTPYQATLRLANNGQFSGQAPCNDYHGKITAPLPWFEVSEITATEMACPALESETAYFAALSEMEFAEVSGPVMLLTNQKGRSMVFHRQ